MAGYSSAVPGQPSYVPVPSPIHERDDGTSRSHKRAKLGRGAKLIHGRTDDDDDEAELIGGQKDGKETQTTSTEYRASLGNGDVMTIKTTGFYQTVGREMCVFTLVPTASAMRSNAFLVNAVIKFDLTTKQSYGIGNRENAVIYGGLQVTRDSICMVAPLRECDVIEMNHHFEPMRGKRGNTMVPVLIPVSDRKIATFSKKGAVRKGTSSKKRKNTKDKDEVVSASSGDDEEEASADERKYDSSVTGDGTPSKPAGMQDDSEPLLLLYRCSSMFLMCPDLAHRSWNAVRLITPGLHEHVMTATEHGDERPLREHCGILNDTLLTIEEFSNSNQHDPTLGKTINTVLGLIAKPLLAALVSPRVVVPAAALGRLTFRRSRKI